MLSAFYFFLPYNFQLISFAHFSIGFRVDLLTVDSSLQIPTFKKGHRSTHGRDEETGGGMCDRYPEFAARMGALRLLGWLD